MKVSVQTDSFAMLKEGVESECDRARFGSEFCEWMIPSLEGLKKAYSLVSDKGKDFIYVTPRVSPSNLEKIQDQLAFLDRQGKIGVVINDLGILNVLEQYQNLKAHLGRQLVYMPARCPWKEITQQPVGFLARRQVAKIFYQTNLNYIPTIQLFQKHGISDVDVDWIPESFSYFNFLAKNGLNLSIHMHLVPIAVTRRCHTARFLGEKSPESCSQPCNTQAFLLKHNILRLELHLYGNAVFRSVKPTKKDAKKLIKNGASEFIIGMNPITKVATREKVNALIHSIQP
ncbi:MAG: hypothetical protein JSV20_09695 [Candidatus Bathyarchaeota archaeon]|nr:MAG: hypothetical protein JSV20_09695 [Candidatus Bathyarchaeota archaeon]